MEHLLAGVLILDMKTVRTRKTPLFLFPGRHDCKVSTGLAAESLRTVKAPQKQLIWFEQSTHEAINEEPGKTLIMRVQKSARLPDARVTLRPECHVTHWARSGQIPAKVAKSAGNA